MIKVLMLVSVLAFATELDEEILNDFEFAMSLQMLESSDSAESWNDLEVIASEDKEDENTKRGQK